MMAKAPRPLAVFRTEIPDDTDYDDEGDIVRFGGRAVAEAIGQLVAQQGLVVDALDYADEHGWEFTAKRPGCKIWFQVALIDKIFMTTKDITFRWRFNKRSDDYGEIIARLNQQLRADGRFHELVWYLPREHDQGGSGSPDPVC